jgi:hypothetical protein
MFIKQSLEDAESRAEKWKIKGKEL